MAERFEYRFEWDPAKAASTAKDHSVTFEQAAKVFLDARLLSQLDEEHEEDEFSRAERGRFFRKHATVRLPIYLEADVQKRVEGLAARTGREMGELVSHIVEAEMQLIGDLEAPKET